MEDAGMKYMLFTSKHHDGFCTFDSKYTDFSIANGPFKDNPRKDVAYHVWDAFRKKGFMMGCYFSKPDWHTEWYWNPYYATPNRHHNYNIKQHPQWWENYQKYTENQLNELMSNYGHFDILWLDGGWVTGEQVNLDRVLEKARKQHPGLISVDRSIRGKNENYQTPERGIPATQLDYPWESCITLSHDWGWVPNAPYKSPQTVVNLLAEICAKGGCFLLGVGPTADGIIEQPIVERLHEVGNWLRQNGQAIYNTRITPHYNDGKVWFTADKDGETLYAIYTVADGETVPETIEWTVNIPKGKVKVLNINKNVKTKVKDGKVIVTLPKGLKNEPIAMQFKIKK
jgi:alpha-L-fucosidase